MKTLLLILLLVFITISSYIVYNTKDYSKSDQIIFKSLINSTLEEFATILKKDVKVLIIKLNKKDIKVLNKEQSITQIALFNKKESAFIINILVE